MKRKLILWSVLLALAVFSASAAVGEGVYDIDLSAYSYDDLVVLRDRINLAMWESEEWQEVTVPIGVWVIGEDIPAGHWSITASPDGPSSWGSVAYGAELDETGKDVVYSLKGPYYREQVKRKGSGAAVNLEEIDLEVKDGMYLVIENTDMVFTPYAGKPSLGFK